MSDLDAVILECRNPIARSYIAEAVACIKVGSFRGSIVLTWVAVVHDLLGKLEELSVAGDKNAERRVEEFRDLVRRHDVKKALEFERSILALARGEFELFGAIALEDLKKLQSDRNRCAHPSMIDEEMDYQPAPELARCHLVHAVEHLLRQAPVQGKAALERLLADLDRTYYPETVELLVQHLAHGPLANPRESLVRNFVAVLLKGIFRDKPVLAGTPFEKFKARSSWIERAHRCMRTLQAIVLLHRAPGLASIHSKIDKMVAEADETCVGAAITLAASVDGCWTALSVPQRNRLESYVANGASQTVCSTLRMAWDVRALRCACQERLSKMDVEGWEKLADTLDVPPEWLSAALEAMLRGYCFAAVNAPARLVASRVTDLSAQQIEDIWAVAKINNQVSHSAGLRDVMNALVQSAQLSPSDARHVVEEIGAVGMYEDQPWWPAA